MPQEQGKLARVLKAGIREELVLAGVCLYTVGKILFLKSDEEMYSCLSQAKDPFKGSSIAPLPSG